MLNNDFFFHIHPQVGVAYRAFDLYYIGHALIVLQKQGKYKTQISHLLSASVVRSAHVKEIFEDMSLWNFMDLSYGFAVIVKF
jgi:hypothetical protein